MAKDKVISVTDDISKVDYLGCEKYYDAIAKFVTTCQTPLTMSIQGDWGTGKTTALFLIDQKIQEIDARKPQLNKSKKLYHSIHFNTWQYSKFGENESLVLALFTKMYKEIIHLADGDQNIVKEAQATIGRIIKGIGAAVFNVGFSVAENYVGSIAGDAKQNIGMNLQNSNFGDLDEEKKKLEELILKCVGENGRIVVFVDDLDRLDPRNAIDLLEGLKVFFDLNQCVFVLAMDKEVVYQGITSKYGSDFAKEKGKKFFDKIIQVPFDLPVAQYDMNKFISNLFNNGNHQLTKTQVSYYVNCVERLGVDNPRAIKRVYNLLGLYETLFSSDLESLTKFEAIENSNFYLFAFLLYRNNNEEEADRLLSISEDKDVVVEETDELYEVLNISECALQDFNSVLKLLSATTTFNGNANMMPLAALRELLENEYQLVLVNDCYYHGNNKICKINPKDDQTYNLSIFECNGTDCAKLKEKFGEAKVKGSVNTKTKSHATLVKPSRELVLAALQIKIPNHAN